MAGRRPADARPSWPNAPAPPSDTCASGSTPRRRAATSSTTRTAGRYTLPPEQAVALTDADSPAFLPGFFQIALGSVHRLAAIIDAARTGPGSAGTSTCPTSTRGASASSAPATTPTSSSSGCRRSTALSAKLERGAHVADVGCGHGASTILMAQAFPNSTFVGSDYHEGSIETARQRAQDAGVDGRVSFETAPASAYSGDQLRPGDHVRLPARHGRPGRRRTPRARHAEPDGTWMIVEPTPATASRTTSTRSDAPSTLLDAPLHARLAVPGGRAGARRPGRRGTYPRRRHGGRLHPLPPGGGDPVQHRVRGQAVTTDGTFRCGTRGCRLTRRVPRRREQTRARYPDSTGYVERDGVRTVLRGLRRWRADDPAAARRGRSSIRAAGRCRFPTSRGTAGW